MPDTTSGLRQIDSQVQDTSSALPIVHSHSPRKAVIYSLICPGLGQIYNKKYWKLPLIYGAGGAFAYFTVYFQLKYSKFRAAVEKNQDTEGSAIIDGSEYSFSTLENGRDGYRRYRDLNVFGFAVIYFLNVVDAMVDAHFFYYDVSDDLTMRLEPALLESPGSTAALGFRINFSF